VGGIEISIEKYKKIGTCFYPKFLWGIINPSPIAINLVPVLFFVYLNVILKSKVQL
jgi:hypothetical protein